MLDEPTKNAIFAHVEDIVDNANFWKYKISFNVIVNYFTYGGGGLLIDAHVCGKDHSNRKLALDLTIKITDKASKGDTIRKAYRREIYLFENILNYMDDYCYDKGVVQCSVVPYYYKGLSTDDRDVLIFNCLTSLGYVHREKVLYIDQYNLYVILKSMAEFHASSFAMLQQEDEEFKQILSKWRTGVKEIFLYSNFEEKLKVGLQMALDVLSEEKHYDLRDSLAKDVEHGPLDVIVKVLSNKPEEALLVHGDLWMQNILILYEKDNPEVARNVKFICWHSSTVHSPVLDLGYFLYFSYSEDIQINFEQYVEYYYQEFSNFLLRLGTDPTTFTFLTLLDHFKKYAIMPLVVALGGIPLVLVDKHMNVDIEDYKTLKYENLDDNLKSLIKKKLLGVIDLHYIYFKD